MSKKNPIKAKREKGYLIIMVPEDKLLPLSKSQKSRIVFQTNFFEETTVEIGGYPVKISMNAIVDPAAVAVEEPVMA